MRITRPFYLGATEVTVGQFRRVVEATGLRTEAETDGKGGYGWNEAKATFEQDPKYTWRNPGFAQTDEHPVVNVSWNDAIAFCNKLSEQEGLKPYYQFGAGAQVGRGRLPAADGGGVGVRLPGGDDDRGTRAATTRRRWPWWATCRRDRQGQVPQLDRRLRRGTAMSSRRRWAGSGRMRSGCTTCTAMSGSGAGTGTSRLL